MVAAKLTIATPLIIDGGEQFILGKHGDYDFVNGYEAGAWWSYHYRKVGMASDGLADHYPTIDDAVYSALNPAPFLTPAIAAAWPNLISIGFEVIVSAWIVNYTEQKAIDVMTSAVNHADHRVFPYTETPYHFLAEAGSAFSQPSDFVKNGMATIPRNGKKLIYEGSSGDALSYPYPSRIAAIPTILATFPFDGVVLVGADPINGGLGRGQFVFTQANTTLTMWRNYFAPLTGANLHGCTHNYVRVPNYTLDYNNQSGELSLNSGTKTHLFDPRDQIIENCGNLARAMSETGTVKGVLIDNEAGATGLWTDQAAYSQTADECYADARLFGNQVIAAFRTWMSDIEVAVLVSPIESIYTAAIHLNTYNELNGAFTAGLLPLATPNTTSNGLSGVRMSSASLGS